MVKVRILTIRTAIVARLLVEAVVVHMLGLVQETVLSPATAVGRSKVGPGRARVGTVMRKTTVGGPPERRCLATERAIERLTRSSCAGGRRSGRHAGRARARFGPVVKPK